MALLRSALLYVFGIAICAGFLPVFLFFGARREWRWPLTRAFLGTLMWGFRHICDLRYRIRGAEHLPASACLIACGQQSTWENIAFPLIFGNPAIWIKTELYRLPVVGWIARANDHIPTDRGGDIAMLKAGMENARRQIGAGRSVLIFPEGTRDTVAGEAVLRKGTGALYALLKRPCVPVVLNSGQFWPYGSYVIWPGEITVDCLQPIGPDLHRGEFEARLKLALDAGAIELAGLPDAEPNSGAADLRTALE